MNEIIKIAQAGNSNILLKESLKQLKMKQKKNGGFLSMLLGTLRAILLAKLLQGKKIVRAVSGCCSLNSSTSYGTMKGKGIVRAAHGNKKEWDF